MSASPERVGAKTGNSLAEFSGGAQRQRAGGTKRAPKKRPEPAQESPRRGEEGEQKKKKKKKKHRDGDRSRSPRKHGAAGDM